MRFRAKRRYLRFKGQPPSVSLLVRKEDFGCNADAPEKTEEATSKLLSLRLVRYSGPVLFRDVQRTSADEQNCWRTCAALPIFYAATQQRLAHGSRFQDCF